MSHKNPPEKRTHAGVCLNLLDDDHKLLLREVALLLTRIALRTEGSMELVSDGTVRKFCALCLARSADHVQNLDKFDELLLVHRPDCVAVHAARVLEADQALRLEGIREYHAPCTTAGLAALQSRQEKHSGAEAQQTSQEVAP